MSARVTSGFWISAFRQHMDALNIPVYIRAHGDETAGAILLKIDTLDGKSQTYTLGHDIDGRETWVELASGPDAEVEASLQRQMKTDPDLWIIEVEDRSGQALFTAGQIPR